MEQANKDLHILCVDDEVSILDVLSKQISQLGFSPLTTSDPSKVPELLEVHAQTTVLIISDFRMDPTDGLMLREQLLPQFESIPFAILSAQVTREMALEGLQRKICAFIDKPFTPEAIKELISKEAKGRINSIREDQELLKGFIQDATNLLEELEPLILSLETSPGDIETLNNIYRILHTIKGTSGFFDTCISKYTHKFEDFLSKFKTGNQEVTPEVVSVFLKGYDTLINLISSITTPKDRKSTLEELIKIFDLTQTAVVEKKSEENPATQEEHTPAQSRGKARDWLKVSTATLDEFMELSGQITVIRNMVNKLVRSIEKEFTGNKDVTLLSELLDEMHKINSSMQDKMVELKKQPLKETFRPLPRLMRDLSDSLGKPFNFVIKGDDLRVDSTIGEVLSNSLVHMLRNCADHGIETPEERKSKTKPEAGSISLTAKQEGEEILIELSDDGRGIDPERIRQKIKEKKMFPPEIADAMSQSRLYQMIFESGFSTAAKVTDVSGRGVGMDMVKTSIEKVRGTIDIRSELGKGTKFILRLPVPRSVLIVNSLMVEAGKNTFAIPQENILRLVTIEPEKIAEKIGSLEGTHLLRMDSRLIPLVWVRDLLKLTNDKKLTQTLKTVIVQVEEGAYGLVVDEILDVEDLVVKPLGRHLKDLSTYSGATFLGDGKVGLILNVENIARLANITIDSMANTTKEIPAKTSPSQKGREFLLFDLDAPGNFAIPLDEVFRLEEFSPSDLKNTGNHHVCIYRESVMPIIPLLKSLMNNEDIVTNLESRVPCIVVKQTNGFKAFSIKSIIDIATYGEDINTDVSDRPGIKGTVYIQDKIFSVIDVKGLKTLFT